MKKKTDFLAHKFSNIKKTKFVINGSFRRAVLRGQNWIAIIAISKNANIRRKENWTEMAWKLQPLLRSEEPFF